MLPAEQIGSQVTTVVVNQLIEHGYVVVTDYSYPSRTYQPKLNQHLETCLSASREQYFAFWQRVAQELEEWILSIADVETDPHFPFWNNDWFPALDALSLGYFIASQKPKRYIEVGSGNSTKFAHSVIRFLGLDTEIVSVDPYPRAEIDALCHRIIRQPVEQCYEELLDLVGPDTVLFVDNSHRSFPGSDVTVFFLSILPALPSGVTWGLHDIFIPYDYPESWTKDENRFYNEQYLLGAYLLGGSVQDDLVLPVYYTEQQGLIPTTLIPACVNSVNRSGGGFWMRRR